MKWFPLLLSQRWISVRGLFIFNDGFKMGCNFPLISCWPSMRKNWLLVSWACAKIGYSLAEHAQKLVAGLAYAKSFRCNKTFPEFPVFCSPCSLFLCPLLPSPVSCLPSYVPCLTFPWFASRPLSPVLRLCSLSVSSVSCFTSLFLVCLLCLLFHISVPCLLSSVPCLKWSVPSPILLSPYPPSSVPCLRWSVPSPILLSRYP